MTLRDRARRWLGITDAAPIARKPIKVSQAALDASARKPAGPPRVKLTLPELPPGVRPANAPVIAMDDSTGLNFPLNWANGMSGVGCGLYFPGYPYLAELLQRPEYRSPVETIAEEMTRKWIEFKSTGTADVSDKIEQITQAFTDFNVQAVFRRALEIDGGFGRCQVYIDTGALLDDRKEPLLLTDKTLPKGSLRGFKAIEPMWTTPVVWNASDPTADDFYKPTTWYVLGTQTHASRLINFVSRPLPDLLKPSYNFGGMSLSQMLQSYVTQWLRTKDAVADLVNNFSKMILLTDMAEILQGDANNTLQMRLQLAIQHGSNQGWFAANKDSEDIKNVSVPLGTLDALQAQAQEHQCAVTRIPLVKQFGISPSGLNATSEFEIVVFYDFIAAMQEKVLDAPIKTALQAIQLHLFGEIDDSIVHDYVPLKELDGEALARVQKMKADGAQIYVTMGAISPDEVRDALQHDPDSGYQNLSGDAPGPPALDLIEAEGASGGDKDDGDGAEDAAPVAGWSMKPRNAA